MADAVNMIRENKGGIAVVSGEDDFKDILELPIAGLMSDRDIEYVSYKLTELQQINSNSLICYQIIYLIPFKG